MKSRQRDMAQYALLVRVAGKSRHQGMGVSLQKSLIKKTHISKTEGIQADNSRKKVLQNLDIREDTLQDIWQDFIEGKGAENPSSPIHSDEFVARYINKFMCIMIMMIYSLKH